MESVEIAECGQMVRTHGVARPCRLVAGHDGYCTVLSQAEINARIDAALFGPSIANSPRPSDRSSR